jgi:hypothetical protein
LEAERFVCYERWVCASVEGASVVSNIEHKTIETTNIKIVPNGVNLNEFPFSRDKRDHTTVVFTNNINYFPNVNTIC